MSMNPADDHASQIPEARRVRGPGDDGHLLETIHGPLPPAEPQSWRSGPTTWHVECFVLGR